MCEGKGKQISISDLLKISIQTDDNIIALSQDILESEYNEIIKRLENKEQKQYLIQQNHLYRL